MRWLLFSILSLYLKQCTGQQIQPVEVTQLPAVINESSGLIVQSPSLFLTINDSGGDPILYAFDDNGNLVDTVSIPGAKNVDWESLTFDRTGQRLFIGDFGNNSQSRKDLKIYWLSWKQDTIAGPIRTLSFSYPDQQHFPAADNFDAEGMFYWSDSLYIFSKNRQLGTGGFAKLYRLPVDTGFHEAILMDSMPTGFPVTGAAIRPDGRQIALLSYGVLMWLDVNNDGFSNGQLTRLGIPFSQTEAIDYWGADTLYYTNEQGTLYLVDLTQSLGYGEGKAPMFTLYPNPATNQIHLHGVADGKEGQVKIFASNGKLMYRTRIQQAPMTIAVKDWPIGAYFVQVKIDGKVFTQPFQKQ